MATSSTKDSTASTVPSDVIDDESSNGQINRLDTRQLREIDDDHDRHCLVLNIDQTTNRKEDENNNDAVDAEFTHISCSMSSDDIDTNDSSQTSMNTNRQAFNDNTNPLATTTIVCDNGEQITSEHEHESTSMATTARKEQSIDDMNTSKR
jgi:hypothetical protein